MISIIHDLPLVFHCNNVYIALFPRYHRLFPKISSGHVTPTMPTRGQMSSQDY